jgi:hypothetical protein
MDRKLNLVNSGNTEYIISIRLLNISDIIDVKIFIQNYKISNFFKGNFFIKRLINKVFKYKLQESMVWDNDFWNLVEITNYKTSINISDKIKNVTEFEKELNKKFSSKRIKNIYKLKKMLNQNIVFDFPLFITGECLDLLGASTPSNSLYMLDGSRRCLAYVLNEINDINTYVMTLKCNK